MKQQQFCVAMSDDYPGTAFAACVRDHKRALAMFFQAHAGCQFKLVSAKEMNELLKAYREAKWGSDEISDAGQRNYLGCTSEGAAVSRPAPASPMASAL